MPQEKPDEYDKLVKEMGFEIRGHASDRSKTAEELAKEERERLEDLEVISLFYHSFKIYIFIVMVMYFLNRNHHAMFVRCYKAGCGMSRMKNYRGFFLAQ